MKSFSPALAVLLMTAIALPAFAQAPADTAPNDRAAMLRHGKAHTRGRAPSHTAVASQNTPRAHARSTGSTADNSADQLNQQQLNKHGS